MCGESSLRRTSGAVSSSRLRACTRVAAKRRSCSRSRAAASALNTRCAPSLAASPRT